MHRPTPELMSGSTTYRVLVAGPVGDGWAEWFDAERVVAGLGTTKIDVRVADQAELLGRLRRLHDLNLRILELTILPAAPEDLPITREMTP